MVARRKTKAKQPHPLISPLVLRATKGDTVTVKLKNKIPNRKVGIHLVGPGANAADDGTHVGNNASSLLNHNQSRTYTWTCDFEDVYVFHDGGDLGVAKAAPMRMVCLAPWWLNRRVRGGQTPKQGITY